MSPSPYLDDYVAVTDRLRRFLEDHPEGEILTSIDWRDTGYALVKATAKIGDRSCTAHAFAKLDDSKALEKAETAAVGRALVHLGYPTRDGEPSGPGPAPSGGNGSGLATSEQWTQAAEVFGSKAKALQATIDFHDLGGASTADITAAQLADVLRVQGHQEALP